MFLYSRPNFELTTLYPYEFLSTTEKSVLKEVRQMDLEEWLKAYAVEPCKKRLFESLQINPPLFTANLLKEDFYRLWFQSSKTRATAIIDLWIAHAEQSEISMLKRFAERLDRYRDGSLAFHDFPISIRPLGYEQ